MAEEEEEEEEEEEAASGKRRVDVHREQCGVERIECEERRDNTEASARVRGGATCASTSTRGERERERPRWRRTGAEALDCEGAPTACAKA